MRLQTGYQGWGGGAIQRKAEVGILGNSHPVGHVAIRRVREGQVVQKVFYQWMVWRISNQDFQFIQKANIPIFLGCVISPPMLIDTEVL